jgi:hypothetical protein
MISEARKALQIGCLHLPSDQESRPGEPRAVYVHIFAYILRMEDGWRSFPSPVAAHKPPTDQVSVLK